MKLSTSLLVLLSVAVVTEALPCDTQNPPDEHTLSARSNLQKRGCTSRQYGCEKGYCWQKCEQQTPGGWCWLAFNGGNGDWVTCSADFDCVNRHDNNPSCANPERPHGGCGC